MVGLARRIFGNDAGAAGKRSRHPQFPAHGGRARAIECGQLKIDVAFIAAPASDPYGNINGVTGPTACGSLGYAFPDAEYADHVVAVTDHLEAYPLSPVSIPQTRVDFVVKIERIGDPKESRRLLAAGVLHCPPAGSWLRLSRGRYRCIAARCFLIPLPGARWLRSMPAELPHHRC